MFLNGISLINTISPIHFEFHKSVHVHRDIPKSSRNIGIELKFDILGWTATFVNKSVVKIDPENGLQWSTVV